MTLKRRQYKKRIGLILVLASMMLVFMAPDMFVSAADEDNWTGLQDKISAGGTIKIGQDYTAGDSDVALVVPENVTVTLDLNGHTIDRGLTEAAEAVAEGNVITVNGNLTITDSSKGKKGTIKGGWNKDSGGGILINEGASFVMNGGTISDNRTNGYDGGGVFVNDEAKSFVMNGGTISGNSSTEGGGVSVHDGIFTMTGGTISGNSCKEAGGGVYITDDEVEFVMNGGTISYNSSEVYGGGVFVEAGAFAMKGGTISNNYSEDKGGGVYIAGYGKIFNMEAGSIEGNRTGNGSDGGGVYAENNIITLSGGNISGNIAGRYGGGVYADSDVKMSAGGVSGNVASDGGGFYVTDHEIVFDMSGGTIKDNEADGTEGGGVYLESNSKFTMTGTSSIKNNKSEEDGGGLSVYGKLTMDSENAVISGNETAVRGGGISTDGGGFIEIKKGTITGNTAVYEGGGIYIRDNCNMTGGNITGNKALGTDEDEGGGGVVVSYSGTFNMTGGNITGNSSVNQGGGIEIEEGGTFNMSGNPVITSNKMGENDNNVYVPSGRYINIADKLESGASVGVTMETPGIFTTGYKDKMNGATPKEFFKTGNAGYGVAEADNGEAMLAEAKTFTVTFVDGQGNKLLVETVESGDAATAPEKPTREGYAFDGWDKDFSKVTADMTVTAKWKKNAAPASDPSQTKPTQSKQTSSKTGQSNSKLVSISNAKVVISAAAFTYNGKAHKPVIRTIGGKALKAGRDYTAKWSNTASKNVGSYTVTITGKGKYTGVTKATYKINPKGTKLKKPRRAKKAIKVRWKKQKTKMSKSRITGYQIQVATNKAFTKNKKTVNVKGYKKTSKKIKKLKGGKRYYVKIRTYKIIKGKKFYSKWSKVRKVKTRK